MADLRPAAASKRRNLREWLAVTLLVAALGTFASLEGWLWRADAALYDITLGFARHPAPADIVIIGIDDASLARLGRWPWRRDLHARLLDRLREAGVKAVALDLLLTEEDRRNPGDDAALVRAVDRHGQVVIPVLYGTTGEIPPWPALADAAAGLGHIHRINDPDGLVRRADLWTSANGRARPHLALALLGVADPERYRAVRNEESRLLIPFAGPPGHFRHLSYEAVLAGRVDAAELAGKVVFVGATATGLSDNVPTPVARDRFDMPGVEIHATLFDALRRGERLHPASPWVAALTTALSLVLLLVGLRRLPPHLGLAASAAFGLLWTAGPALALLGGGLWLPPAGVLLGTALAYPLWSWRRLAAAQRSMDEQLKLLGREPGIVDLRPASAMPADPFARRIDEVQAAIERLRAARAFIQEVLDGLPAGVLVATAQRRVVLVNSQAAALLGLTAGEITPGQPLGEVLASLQWPDGDPLAADPAGNVSRLACHRDRERYLLAGLVPFRFGGQGGPEDGLLLTLTDTTALHQAQAAREQALQFLSHDLRSPLASILTLLADPTATDPGGRIAGHARNALALADGFTQLARAEAADAARFQEIDLAAVAHDAVDELWPQAKARRIALVRDIPGEEALVRGDGDLLRRALINLVGNAVRYSPEDTAVSVRLAADPAGWRLDVSDQGYGIAEADLPRLFTRFTRLRAPGQPAVPGTGLGLAMVKTTVERHGGRLSVTSTLGRGSCFSLQLPAIQP